MFISRNLGLDGNGGTRQDLRQRSRILCLSLSLSLSLFVLLLFLGYPFSLGGVRLKEAFRESINSGSGKYVLLVDHEDSFVHTLGNYLRQTGAEV